MGVKGKHQQIYNSYGAYDAYKWIRKNKWLRIGKPITEHQFYTILRKTNLFYQQQLVLGLSMRLPHSMGEFGIFRVEIYKKFENGVFRTNMPVDWKKTKELWKEDEECRNKRLRIRREAECKYLISYIRKYAIYANNIYVVFTPCRDLVTQLGYKASEGNIGGYEPPSRIRK